MDECPLCGMKFVTFQTTSTTTFPIECPRCGSFSVTFTAYRSLPDALKPYLSMYTRMRKETGLTPQRLESANLSALADTYRHTGVLQKIDYLLRFVERRTHFFDEPIGFDAALDWPAIAALNQTEACNIVRAAAELGHVAVKADNAQLQQKELALTVKGWEKLGGGPSVEASGRCFVAMSFDQSLERAFVDGIRPAIEADLAYEAIRVDKVHHNEKICHKILAEIRRAQFVVADVTMQRQGVYFEAGFAMALGRPIIWSCREDDLANAHFDTRQYNHTVWSDPNDLRTKLKERILATIGDRKRRF